MGKATIEFSAMVIYVKIIVFEIKMPRNAVNLPQNIKKCDGWRPAPIGEKRPSAHGDSPETSASGVFGLMPSVEQ